MAKCLSFLHFVAIIFVSLSRSFAHVPASQIIVLHNLYTSSNGDHWIWKPQSSQPRWNFSTSTVNPCSTDSQTWQGITCDKPPSSCQQAQDICHIIDLSLVEFNLTGALPSLSNLTKLQTLLLDSNYLQGPLPLSPFPLLLTRLSLYHNQFTSTLPSDISNCLRLRSIELSVNQFTGSIPSGIGLFLQLRTLYLDANSLTGPIPSTFQFLSQINYLILSGNSLTGEIPSFMGSLTTLRVFILSDNSNMTGTIPPELGSLTRLQILMLMNTGRSGPLIPELWSLTNLMILELCKNSLTGILPPAISSLRNLQLLLLNTCLLDGPIPSTLSQLTLLYLLDLEGNYFTSSVPLNMFPMMQQSLHHLTLSSNLLTSSLPLDITSLSFLETLTLEDNYFTGTLPNEISQLSSLNLFSLQHNLFTSSFPIGIGALTQLTVLTLQGNAFSLSLPASLSNLTQLLVLDLSSNLFTSSFPVFLSSMPHLQELYLQDNLLTSSISPFLVNASHLPLLSLDMSDNYFSNTIPAELFLISSLQILSLTRNCFHGTLPSTICAASSLVILSMDGLGAASSCPGSISIPWTTVVLNSVLDGSIPSCIWTDLKENLILLSLSGNGLTGNIESIPTDSNLINISLSHNHLTGTIPKALFHPPSCLSRLQAVDLSYNKFIGSIPTTFQSYPFTIRLVNFQVNRLSGDAPPSPLFLSNSTTSPSSGKPNSPLGILETSLIKILEGNLFSCARLPSYDPDSAVYTCGAKAFNQSLYTLSAVGGFLILGILLCLLARYNQTVWGSREVRITEHRITKNTTRLLFMESIQLLSSLYQQTRDYYFYIYPSPPSPLSASDTLASSAPTSPLLLSFRSNNDLFKSMEFLSATLFVIGLISSLPFYLLKSDSTNPSSGPTHSTHVDVYEWIYTASYTSGILPALVLMASWALTITAYLSFFHFQFLLQRRQTEEEAAQLTRTSATLLPILPTAGKRPFTLQSLDIEKGSVVSPISIPLFSSTTLISLLHLLSGSFRVLINIAVVGTVNALYILSLRRNLSPTQHLLCEISIAIFSIFWKGLCLPLLFSTSNSSSSYSEYKTFSSTLNSLFIPCLTTALTSTSCYQVTPSPTHTLPPSLRSSRAHRVCLWSRAPSRSPILSSIAPHTSSLLSLRLLPATPTPPAS
jgi:Leucine-rich repeat (LRR) protein